MVPIPPRILHVVQPEGGRGLIQRVIHFELRDLTLSGSVTRTLTLPAKSQKQVARIFRELREEWSFTANYRGTVVAGMLAALIGIYLRHSDQPEKGEPIHSPGWPSVEKAVRFMQQHYRDQELSLPAISLAAGVSPNYLCRIFKENTGGSVMRYLMEIRIQRAGEQLIHSTDNCT